MRLATAQRAGHLAGRRAGARLAGGSRSLRGRLVAGRPRRPWGQAGGAYGGAIALHGAHLPGGTSRGGIAGAVAVSGGGGFDVAAERLLAGGRVVRGAMVRRRQADAGLCHLGGDRRLGRVATGRAAAGTAAIGLPLRIRLGRQPRGLLAGRPLDGADRPGNGRHAAQYARRQPHRLGPGGRARRQRHDRLAWTRRRLPDASRRGRGDLLRRTVLSIARRHAGAGHGHGHLPGSQPARRPRRAAAPGRRTGAGAAAGDVSGPAGRRGHDAGGRAAGQRAIRARGVHRRRCPSRGRDDCLLCQRRVGLFGDSAAGARFLRPRQPHDAVAFGPAGPGCQRGPRPAVGVAAGRTGAGVGHVDRGRGPGDHSGRLIVA